MEGLAAFVFSVLVLALIFAVGLTLLTALLAAAAVVAVAVGIGYAIYYLWKTSDEQRKREEAELARLEAERLRLEQEQAEIKLLTEQSSAPLPSVQKFTLDFARELKSALHDAHILEPPEVITLELLRIVKQVYERELPPRVPPNSDKIALQAAAQRAQNFDPGAIAKALAQSFHAFLTLLPPFKQSQFMVPVAELIDLPSATYGMIEQPFRADALFAKGLCLSIWQTFQQNCVKMGGGDVPKYPQELGKTDWTKYKIAHAYLKDTPFNQLFQTHVPFGFTDKERTEHQIITAPSGQGKTTYVCNLIRADLERVVRDEVCVVVIDPKGALSQLARYKEFSQGGKLENRLIYIEPSSAHPLALNPFRIQHDRDSEEQRNSAVDMLTYALGSLFETEPTVIQSGVLQYLIRLMLEIPNSTLHTLNDFLTEKNYLKEEYQSVIRRMKDPYRSFLINEIPTLRPDTKAGIRQRIFILMARPEVERMFCASQCRFDMFTQTLKGKVIVVDANVGVLTQEPMEVFGRLFLAMLLHTSRRRMGPSYKGPKPFIFAYVDEAQHFVKRDPRTPTIINEVRAQNIGVTFSPQSLADIEDPRVRAALSERSNIRVRTRKGSAQVEVGYEEETKRYALHVDNFRYHIEGKDPHAPHMSTDEFEDIRVQMRRDFCAEHPPLDREFEESYERP